MKLKLIFAVAMICAPVGASAAEWWQGIWAWDKEWCARANQIGSVTPAPIAITAREVHGYENTCQIRQATPLKGMAAVHLDMVCMGEGSTYNEQRLMMGQGDMAWMWFGQDKPLMFHRCPNPGNSMDWLNKK